MDEHKMILTMLNEGKISAEEAEKLLYAVKGKDSGALKGLKLKPKMTVASLKVPSAGHKLAKFFDRVVHRIKTADFDLNFGPSEEVNYTFQDSHVMFQEVDVEVYNGSVTIVPWDRPDVQIECHAFVYKIPEGSSAKTKFRNETFYDCDATRLRFYSRNKQQKVNAVISLPYRLYEDMKISTFNGPVKLNGCEVKELTIKTTIGSIAVSDCKGEKIHTEAANGSITVKDCHYHDVDAETMNGPLRLTVDAEQIRGETMNGAIFCRLGKAAEGYAFFKTVTGKIEAEFPEEMELDATLKTLVGGFICDFDTVEVKEEKKEVARKLLSFTANRGTTPAFRLEAEAKTGSVSILKAK